MELEARREFHVVIVGGGFAGTALALHLLRDANPRLPLRISLVERRGSFGPGLAYSAPSTRLLLNVRSLDLGVWQSQERDFYDWLLAAGHPDQAQGFASRALYGAYLQHRLQEACGSDSPLHLLDDEVEDIQGLAAGRPKLRVELARGPSLLANAVVLATGNERSARPRALSPALLESPAYLGHPLGDAALEGIDRDAELFILGSGLTMVDVLTLLDERGHRGAVQVLSRHGLLPTPHLPEKPADAFALSPQWMTPPKSLSALTRLMREEIARARASGRSPGCVIAALRPRISQLWQALGLREKQRFLRHLRTYWDIARHRMPPESARLVEKMRSAERLHVIAGRLISADLEGEKVCVRYRSRSGELVERRVDRFLNCTGPDRHLHASHNPPLRALLERGELEVDALGFSPVLAPALHSKARKRLHWLGPLRVGELWESTAIVEIRTQAATLARQLLAQAEDEMRGGTQPSSSLDPRAT